MAEVRRPIRWIVTFVLAGVAGAAPAAWAQHGTPVCSAAEIGEILKPARDSHDSVQVTCSATLGAGQIISRRLVFGPAANGVVFDCGGGAIENPQIGTRSFDHYRILIRSQVEQTAPAGVWSTARQARDITIRNCTVRGAIQISSSLRGEAVRESSWRPGHTGRMREAAPRNIRLEELKVEGVPLANGKKVRDLLYVSVGTTGVTLRGSRFTGAVDAIAIYLDAESTGHRIEDNIFSVATTRRELIAIDGSSNNAIERNRFQNPVNGVIYVYRNCGEKGIVRHNEPRRNVIAGNTIEFTRRGMRHRNLIWIASRDRGTGFKSWCDHDRGHGVGSSIDDSDQAKNNRVVNNVFVNTSARSAVVIDDPDNTAAGNTFVTKP